MADSTNVVFINFTSNYRRRIQARKPRDKQFVVECAYCDGTGRDPNLAKSMLTTNPPCSARNPVCNGGWRTLQGRPDNYRRCGSCDGTGKDEDILLGLGPCQQCHGIGLVRVL